MGEAGDQTSGALTRRNAIKAAAAVGVGAAAWTGPNIGVFGASPAYAGVCRPGEEDCKTSNRVEGQPSSCNGGTGQNRSFQFDGLSVPALSIDGDPVTVTVNTGCTSGAAGGISVSPNTLTCRATARTYTSASAATPNGTYFGTEGTGSIPIPLITLGSFGGGNFFIEIEVCCSSDPEDCRGGGLF